MMPNQIPGAISQAPYQRQPAQWQPQRVPSSPQQATGAQAKPPITARGVSATPQAPAIQKFVVPGPQALGVSTSLSMPEPKAAAAAVDWNQLQARMERLGVLRYQKAKAENGEVHVTMLFPTSDPTKGQPMSAQSETEAAAVVMILNHAEELARKR